MMCPWKCRQKDSAKRTCLAVVFGALLCMGTLVACQPEEEEHVCTSGEWIVDKQPTCTEDGSSSLYCTECGALMGTAVVPATGHTESDWIVDKEATYTESGSRHKECTVCHEVLVTEGIPMIGHTCDFDEWVVQKEETCTASGKRSRTCKTCGLVQEEILPALGHSLTHYEQVNPSCESDGNIEYWECARCGGCYTDSVCQHQVTKGQTSLEALGHAVTHREAVAADCEHEGNIEYWTCSRCEGYYQDAACTEAITQSDTVTEALGHELTHHAAVEATCTEKGNIEYWTCSRCGHYYKDEACTEETTKTGVELKALGHATTHHAAVAVNCTADGNIEYWTCSRCEGYYKDEACTIKTTASAIVIQALGHNKTHHAAVAATCTTAGNIEHWVCSNCQKCFTDAACTQEVTHSDTVIAALGHNLAHYSAISPSCTAEGRIEYWYCNTCKKCFKDAACTQEVAREDTILSATGHSLTHHAAVASTCSTNGNVEYWTCDTCGNYYFDASASQSANKYNVVIASRGHTYVDGVCSRCQAAEPAVYTRSGSTVTFGSYPQTKVTDTDLINTLNFLAGDKPTLGQSSFGKWLSYGYYSNGEVSHYMWYQDVHCGADVYRGVFFVSYREGGSHSQSTYSINTVYWFKFEPLTWHVLSETDTAMFLFTDEIIDAQPYNITTGAEYADSSIRTFLTNTFYNWAFRESQQNSILTTQVSNTYKVYEAATTTDDKVFLLSLFEAQNTEYGFVNQREVSALRKKSATQYALSQGLRQFFGKNYWWSRTISDAECSTVFMDCGGQMVLAGNCSNTDIGVVPALWLNK